MLINVNQQSNLGEQTFIQPQASRLNPLQRQDIHHLYQEHRLHLVRIPMAAP